VVPWLVKRIYQDKQVEQAKGLLGLCEEKQ
jgi:hypothetical protein